MCVHNAVTITVGRRTFNTIGTTVAKGSPLITLDTGNRDEIITYVTDRDIGGVQPNTVYRFVPHSMPHKTIWAKFVSMSPSPVDVLGEPQLDQQLGGGIPATGQFETGQARLSGGTGRQNRCVHTDPDHGQSVHTSAQGKHCFINLATGGKRGHS